jgi:endonuclease/exonuclease/phosphatase family metal-dependent hydrolase
MPEFPTSEFSVAAFNLHWGVDMRGHEYDALAACLALDADVLVLPEAWRPFGRTAMVDELVERIGGTLHGVTFMTDRDHSRPRHLRPPPGPPGTCGLVMISRLPVLSFTDILVPKTAGDVVEQRRAIVAEVDVAGTTVAIGGLHASHRIWGSIPQLRVLDADLRRRGHPSVIAGDCNMWGPPIRAALPHRAGAVRGRTWPSWRPHSQIDHIWIDDRVEVVRADIGPHVGSDHRAVRATVRVS